MRIMLRSCFTLTMIVAASSLWAQGALQRAAVPDEAELNKAKQVVAEAYRDEYTQAKSIEQKLALVDKLMGTALKTNNDPQGKYALLVIARDIAVGAGDWEASLRAVEQLSLFYDVDPYVLADEVRAKIELGGKPPRSAKNAYFAVMAVVDGAIAKDEYEVAEHFVESAKKLARRVGDAQTLKDLSDRIPNLQKMQRQYVAVKDSLAALQKNIVDPEANLAVGKFRCLMQERWDEGLPLLALGSDTALAKAAEMELRNPEDPNELLAIADGWWDLAEADKEHQNILRRHAIDRYLRAIPRLSGLPRRKAETRITDNEQWLSKDAVYTVSKLEKDFLPLASLLSTNEKFHSHDGTQFAFQIGAADGYIVIDLKREVPISRIYIQNRPVHDRTRGTGIFLSKSADHRGDKVWTAPDNAAEWTIFMPKLMTARYITIARDPNVGGDDGWLHLRKVKVFGPQ